MLGALPLTRSHLTCSHELNEHLHENIKRIFVRVEKLTKSILCFFENHNFFQKYFIRTFRKKFFGLSLVEHSCASHSCRSGTHARGSVCSGSCLRPVPGLIHSRSCVRCVRVVPTLTLVCSTALRSHKLARLTHSQAPHPLTPYPLSPLTHSPLSHFAPRK